MKTSSRKRVCCAQEAGGEHMLAFPSPVGAINFCFEVQSNAWLQCAMHDGRHHQSIS